MLASFLRHLADRRGRLPSRDSGHASPGQRSLLALRGVSTKEPGRSDTRQAGTAYRALKCPTFGGDP
ncbi:hypothetical protein H4W32_000322 [Actinophytocola algeriensis]|uniref:Uncharacterized protein n=1 Tax=Actinophytocola algeriensis TaxID=1768010 RepID=A0A7W7Q2W4_9PSEU|nr:hypothetical protein [Actinophytocola algeriensis]MBE1472280.1 hypothetical protein [Actinophytocola algeriensis]